MKHSKLMLITLLFTITPIVNSAPLNPSGPEAKQLEAMGYEVKVLTGTDLTIATLGSTKILFSKNEERLLIFRMFTSGSNKSQQQRFEILEIMNKINADSAYQVSLEDAGMNVALYKFGAFDPKTLALLIRLIERANTLFDRHPKLIELLK